MSNALELRGVTTLVTSPLSFCCDAIEACCGSLLIVGATNENPLNTCWVCADAGTPGESDRVLYSYFLSVHLYLQTILELIALTKKISELFYYDQI